MPDHADSPRYGDDIPSRNIALPEGFGRRLRRLREERHLSKTDLADRAGISERTVQNLEKRRRDRALQKTLLAVAEALEMPYDELLDAGAGGDAGGAPVTARRTGVAAPRVILAVLLAVVAGSLFGLWNYGRAHAGIAVADYRLTARHAILGTRLWRYDGPSSVTGAWIAPWSDDVVIITLGLLSDGQPLRAVDRASGRVLWQAGPDLAQLQRSVGADMLAGATMGGKALDFGDVDGDGRQEIVVSFVHGRYHPTAVCLFDQDGSLLRQYANKGHLLGLLVADLDADGRDEILATGTNNAPAYAGPTAVLLDDRHWRGASVDSLCNPWSTEPDSCAVRIVFPGLPEAYRTHMRTERFTGIEPSFQVMPDGQPIIAVLVSGRARGESFMRITLDGRLRPRGADVEDALTSRLRAAGADSLVGVGPGDPGWRAEWVAGAARFGAAAEAR